MGSSEASGDCEGEMDDSGCIEGGPPPAKKMCMDAAQTEMTQRVQLLNLSDDVLLGIFQHCNAFDLKALAFTCTRLWRLVRDRTLWRRVDARSRPVGRARLKWFTGVFSEGTTELMLSGYAKDAEGCLGHVAGHKTVPSGGGGDAGVEQSDSPPERRADIEGRGRVAGGGGPPYPLYRQHARLHINAFQLPRMSGSPAWCERHPVAEPDGAAGAVTGCAGPQFTVTRRDMARLARACPALTYLALEYCNINCAKVAISDFPPTLTRLSLKGTRCYNMPTDKTYLFKIQESLPLLEHLDLSCCEWVEPVSLLPLSKARRLCALYMRHCLRMTEFVAYAALAYRYGFRALKVLDMRGSPVGDSEVTGLGWAPVLEELYLSPPAGPALAEPPAHAHRPTDALPRHQELDLWEMDTEACYGNGEAPSSPSSEDEARRGGFDDAESSDLEGLWAQVPGDHGNEVIIIANGRGPPLQHVIDRIEANRQQQRQEANNSNDQSNNDGIPNKKKNKRRSTQKGSNDNQSVSDNNQREDNFSDKFSNQEENNGDQCSKVKNKVSSPKVKRRCVENEEQDREENTCRDVEEKCSDVQEKNTEKTGCDNSSSSLMLDSKTTGIDNEEAKDVKNEFGNTITRLNSSQEAAGCKNASLNARDPQPSCSKSDEGKKISKKGKLKLEGDDSFNDTFSTDSEFDSSDECPSPITEQANCEADTTDSDEDSGKDLTNNRNTANKPSSSKYVTLLRKIDEAGTHYVTFRRRSDDSESSTTDRSEGNNSTNTIQDKNSKISERQESKYVTFKRNPTSTTEDSEPTSSRCLAFQERSPKVLNFRNDVDTNGANYVTFKRQTDGNGATVVVTIKRKYDGDDSQGDAKRRNEGQTSDNEMNCNNNNNEETIHEDNNNTGERDENSNSVIPIEPEARPSRVLAVTIEPEAGPSRERHSDDSSSTDEHNSSKDTNAENKSKANKTTITFRRVPQEAGSFVLPRASPQRRRSHAERRLIDPVHDPNEDPGPNNEANNHNLNNIEVVDAEPRHHILYLNVSHQLPAVYRLNRNRSMPPMFTTHIEYPSLVSDSAIRRFGRAEQEDDMNFVNIGPNGPVPGRIIGGGRPDRSNLRVLEATGYRNITDRSLVHLATAAPYLRRVNFSNTNVTEAGVERFKSLRPDVEVVFSKFVEDNN